MKEYIMAEGHLDKLITIAIIVVVFAGLISITNRIFRRINRRKNSIFYKFLNSVVYVVLLATPCCHSLTWRVRSVPSSCKVVP